MTTSTSCPTGTGVQFDVTAAKVDLCGVTQRHRRDGARPMVTHGFETPAPDAVMRDSDSDSARAMQIPTGVTATATGPGIAEAKVVFLTLNDVYELFPNDDGQGGVAEFASLLEQAKASVPDDCTAVVTLNGDFLWRSELDRQDKGPHMMELLTALGIEYVVLGNHEFDFGAAYCQELLANAAFTCFGSNIRQSSTGNLMQGLTDTVMIPLSNGLRLGMFGVCTTETEDDGLAGDLVRFEDETTHARRCVESLQAQGADVVVALTHMKIKQDKQLVRHVPGISLVLGGHDHEPMTEFVGHTMIHKSGQNALWLGKVELTVHKLRDHDESSGLIPSTIVNHQWQMVYNRGYTPQEKCLTILRAYARLVEADDEAKGKLVPLATSLTLLDGTRATSRTAECNVGNLVADAMRAELDTDVALIHAGLIKGDKLHPPGIVLTPKWLERVLPQPKATVVVQMTVRLLKEALQLMLRQYPSRSSSMPQTSGLRMVYDVSTSPMPCISSLRLASQRDEDQLPMDQVVTVALPVTPATEVWRACFSLARELRRGPIVRDVVARFLTRHAPREIAYARSEHRLVVM